jgi:hypothetical protein
MRGRRVLICALDWGLGHASRCVPLARRWQAEGAEVRLASAGRALALLRRECPDLPCLEMPAYGIRYFSNNMYVNMAAQGPRLLRAAWAERGWLAAQLRRQPADVVVSDNRYGCYHPGAYGIFLSHQLNIQLPGYWLHRGVNAAQQALLRNFQEVWAPDYDMPGYRLAGALAHELPPGALPPVRYVGWLSRMTPAPAAAADGPLVALLSGPEPQRRYWEQEVRRQLRAWGRPALLVRGLPERQGITRAGALTIVDHLAGEALAEALRHAPAVLCRSGYSTLMDMATLGQRVALIPTPGQTEQEYLAQHCAAQGWAPWAGQREARLEALLEALPACKGLPGLPPGVGSEAPAPQWV